jgi:predicted nucleotidyltransferase
MAASSQVNPHLSVTAEQIAEFCQRWKISEMALLGSVVRDDFRPDSDVDVILRASGDSSSQGGHLP